MLRESTFSASRDEEFAFSLCLVFNAEGEGYRFLQISVNYHITRRHISGDNTLQRISVQKQVTTHLINLRQNNDGAMNGVSNRE
jgi:hypothetical protein